MPLTDKIEKTHRGTMVMFFVIDTSGSMLGRKLNAVNAAMEEAIPVLRELGKETNVRINIAVLSFSSDVRWITAGGPVDTEQFRWNYLEAEGFTGFGAACKVLNEKLSTKTIVNEFDHYITPMVILLMDGDPTDEWKRYLAELKQNEWFKPAVKFAIAIGDDANKDLLEEFTGAMETVLEAPEEEAPTLMEKIKFVISQASGVAANGPIVYTGGAGECDESAKEPRQEASGDGMGELREEMAALRSDIAALRSDLAAFRAGTAAPDSKDEEEW